MNRIIALLSFFYLFSAIGCKDDDSKEDMNVIPGWGSSSASINNEQWDGIPQLNSYVTHPDLYSFSVRKYSGEGFLRSELDINAVKYDQLISDKKIKLQKINYQIFLDTISVGFYTFRSDGDVVTGVYTVIENDTIEDYVQFFDFDNITKEVSGIFQASFVVAEGFNSSQSGYGDTIIIKDGVFHTKIQ